MLWNRTSFALLLLTALASAQQASVPNTDPSAGEVPLPCAKGWDARLLFETGVGVWTVGSFQLQPRYGCPEVVGLDDRGRCTILRSYSGKWKPLQTIEDGKWLAPVAHGEADPARAGRELYAGGQRGRVYQIWPRPTGGFDTQVVAEFPGDEIHTLVAADLLPQRAADELLVFTLSGAVYELRHDGAKFSPVRIATLPGRVRDAVVLPKRGNEPPRIASVSRAREVAILQWTENGFERRPILVEDMGFGRIARRKTLLPGPVVLYVTRDDGLVLRLAEREDGSFEREVVYAGPPGPRGLVAGRFFEDPDIESLAVFGYSKKVQLLARGSDGHWNVETIFTDVDKGHWLTLAEVDGRNATDEIIGSGYGGRIFALARPPGFGLGGVATDPDGRPRAPSSTTVIPAPAATIGK